MEGRDIGTVVFPGCPDQGVSRRVGGGAGQAPRQRSGAHRRPQVDVGHVQSAMAARDQSDSTRTVAPLLMAADAIYVDTTEMDADAVFERVLGLVRQRRGVHCRLMIANRAIH